MTPTLHPDSDLLGVWHGVTRLGSAQPAASSQPVEFIIHHDGLVTGTVGEATVIEGRITYGRSWFGRLLHMNAAYIIRGTLPTASDRFTVPLQIHGGILHGTLFLRNRPMDLMLTRPGRS